ncbi:hypothetical protein ACFQO1_11370 [Jejudonia soesokkakensis]|uniref:Uncharacterized protein n=1 Tax=Jejudonia soesokkakensis TaxID=1323432 RepID=A0ABW2MXH1_9FLAO
MTTIIKFIIATVLGILGKEVPPDYHTEQSSEIVNCIQQTEHAYLINTLDFINQSKSEHDVQKN